MAVDAYRVLIDAAASEDISIANYIKASLAIRLRAHTKVKQEADTALGRASRLARRGLAQKLEKICALPDNILAPYLLEQRVYFNDTDAPFDQFYLEERPGAGRVLVMKTGGGTTTTPFALVIHTIRKWLEKNPLAPLPDEAQNNQT